ncbi:flagellar assembly protein FliW [Sporolactobacillus sp. CPB3-1]|uniref:Flagellar assembly factor FliW n=1 Tax=Sporolactobacillus mangiferae TaxID=2940498 RepID=A0ABT0MEA5_9BACL|nr:flagellar assembly protein FliW [Sporolactobacillus mangiferae]MCL1632650.1 flagellar assembly protein FliW [Sporolactobacillus mangiferae]
MRKDSRDKMMIQTKYFGKQEITETDIVRFSSGIPGFVQNKQYVIQPFGELFSVLQSVNEAHVAFIITSPFFYFKDYSVDLPDHFIDQLHIQSHEDVTVWVIVSVRQPFSQSTVNLRAPIIINIKDRIGKQYIPERSGYSLRTPINANLQEKKV